MDSTRNGFLHAKVFPDSYYSDPSLYEFFQRIGIALKEFGYNFEKYPIDLSFMFNMLLSIKFQDVATVLLLASAFTVARQLCTNALFMPLADKLLVQPTHRSKFPESAWKFLFYTILWSCTYYVVICSGRYDFFQNPLDIMRSIHFDDGYLKQPVPSDIYWLYIMQLGFYVHSIFSTLYMDVWRKDSVMMLFHHILTIFLLEFSFLMKYYKMGALVLFLHDLCDVLLEFTKLNMYLKDRGGKHRRCHELCANIGFCSFAISWAWFRLYWFPLKVLYTCHWGVYLYHKDKDPKMFLFFNSMLFALQFLHLYWFYFVMLVLVRVVTGRQQEVEDTREFEERKHENGHTD